MNTPHLTNDQEFLADNAYGLTKPARHSATCHAKLISDIQWRQDGHERSMQMIEMIGCYWQKTRLSVETSLLDDAAGRCPSIGDIAPHETSEREVHPTFNGHNKQHMQKICRISSRKAISIKYPASNQECNLISNLAYYLNKAPDI